MRRPSSEFRDATQDALADDYGLRRLWRLRMFQGASNVAEVRHLAEAIVRMTDEEIDRLRDHIDQRSNDESQTGGHSYQHPPPEWMDGITRKLLGLPPRMEGSQA